MGLGVTLTGCEYHGTGLFEHRDEIVAHEGGGEEVFGGAEEFGALPAPHTLLHVIETAVARPKGQVTIVEPVGGHKR